VDRWNYGDATIMNRTYERDVAVSEVAVLLSVVLGISKGTRHMQLPKDNKKHAWLRDRAFRRGDVRN
jgi:hypothetical protein